jgi:hypothetical protein
MVRNQYPESVVEVLDDRVQYSTAVIDAVQTFSAANPWKGPATARKLKFLQLNRDLASACSIREPALEFGLLDGSSSGASYYNSRDHRIVIVGKLSVVTYLHEFAHALGYDEPDACRWSVNLFRRCFPRQYSRLVHVGHTLVRPQDISAALAKEGVR